MSKIQISRRNLLQSFAGFSITALGSLAIPGAIAQQCSPTTSDVQGPFYLSGAPHRTALAGPQELGERIVIRGTVFGVDCRSPISSTLLDVWQADAQGQYHNERENYRLRGQMRTGNQGIYEFTSILPGRYQLDGGFRPAHIHFTITHPDFAALTTQLYFQGDPYLAPNDACGDGCKSNDPQRIIELRRVQQGGKVFLEGRFDVILKSTKG